MTVTTEPATKKLAGMYIFRLQNSSSYTFYKILQLRSDGSSVFTGSDAEGYDAAIKSQPGYSTPYGDSYGKWFCVNSEVHAYSYEWGYPYTGNPNAGAIFATFTNFTVTPVGTDGATIAGNYFVQGYAIGSTNLKQFDEKNQDDLDKDKVGDRASATLTGYKIQKFCN